MSPPSFLFDTVSECHGTAWAQTFWFKISLYFLCPDVQASFLCPLSSQNAQRLGGSQGNLSTPVISVATPSLLAPFSAMQTAYNTGEEKGTRCSRAKLAEYWNWTHTVCLKASVLGPVDDRNTRVNTFD
jgi:hypothetical protein